MTQRQQHGSAASHRNIHLFAAGAVQCPCCPLPFCEHGRRVSNLLARHRLQVSSDESARLIKMEETLHNRVIGQEEAVVAISRAIRRARVGLKSPNRPIASFIFSGAPL